MMANDNMHDLYVIVSSLKYWGDIVVRELFNEDTTIISHTSRQPQAGETIDLDHYFVTEEELSKMSLSDELLFLTEVDDRHYGYCKNEVYNKLKHHNCVTVASCEELGSFLTNKSLSKHIVPVFLFGSKIHGDRNGASFLYHSHLENDRKHILDVSYLDEKALVEEVKSIMAYEELKKETDL